MNVSLDLKNFTWPGGPPAIGKTMASIARRADAAGFYAIWAMDHFFQLPFLGPAENDMPECYSLLNFIAGHTERVKLGVMVTGVTYRHPGFLIKQATTLDVLSGGRAYFGIGAAWFEREHTGLGFPFPPLAERFRRLEETLQIARKMWSGDRTPFEGRYYQLAEPICEPRPVSHPWPPILVGGSGEQKTLRLVARYADACNISGPDLPALRHKLDVLREHCAAEGRDYDTIEKTTNLRVRLSRDGRDGTYTPEAALELLNGYAGLGYTHANCMVSDMHDPGTLELWGERVIPAASRL